MVTASIKKYLEDSGLLFSSLPFSLCSIINQRKLEQCSIKDPCSVITLAVPYFKGHTDRSNISLYARSLDYHLFFSRFFEDAIRFLEDMFEGYSFCGYADNSFIDERHAAVISGIGVYGDNGTVITEEYGSYVFLGEIVTNLPFSLVESLKKSKNYDFTTCLHCGKCKNACPMKNGQSDDCLSAITQKKKDLTDKETALMKKYNTAWGCDICQSVCPMNKDIKQSDIAFFDERRTEDISTDIISAMSDAEFSERAFAWRGRKTIMRNLEYLKENDNDKS